MRARLQGFTLLELLVVIAIIGILSALFFNVYARLQQQETVRQGAQQFMGDLLSARSTARRLGQDVEVVANVNAGSYTVTRQSPGAPVVQTYTLPGNLKFGGASNLDVTFNRPHGFATQFLNADGARITLVLASRSIAVYVIGLAGKVVLHEN